MGYADDLAFGKGTAVAYVGLKLLLHPAAPLFKNREKRRFDCSFKTAVRFIGFYLGVRLPVTKAESLFPVSG